MWRLRRVGFFLGLAAAAGASTAAVHGVAALLGGADVRDALAVPEGCGPPAETPRTVTARFLRTAVLRQNEACSYELVTRNVRLGLSRSEWANGDIPVVPFPTERPETLRIETRVKAAAPGERASVVVLAAADLGAAIFDLVLVRAAGVWRVDYWAPAYTPGAPYGGAA